MKGRRTERQSEQGRKKPRGGGEKKKTERA
jgi:hypothetical protein